ncbi:MAG: DUF2071 domain-containing protein [Actinomycetota bacterium]
MPGHRRLVLMRQTWANIVWCHWPVPVEELQAILPRGLEPDVFDGQAWVGLVPFSMQNLRIPGPFGFITRLLRSANFGEVNVRTYVKGPDGRTGVWFCTLDADSMAAVATANAAFGLPYRVAKTSFTHEKGLLRWYSQRRGDRAIASLEVKLGDAPSRPSASGLETFLFERYSLYSIWHGILIRGELSHVPWTVKPVDLVSVETHTLEAAGFNVSGKPHVFAGEAVEVSIHPMKIVRRNHD